MRVTLFSRQHQIVPELTDISANGDNVESTLLLQQDGQRVKVQGVIARKGDTNRGSVWHLPRKILFPYCGISFSVRPQWMFIDIFQQVVGTFY